MKYKETSKIELIEIDLSYQSVIEGVLALMGWEGLFLVEEDSIEEHEKAAFLYLLEFNAFESDYSQIQEEALSRINFALKAMKWPTDVVYDNDGEPMVIWPKGFDWYEWLEIHLTGGQ